MRTALSGQHGYCNSLMPSRLSSLVKAAVVRIQPQTISGLPSGRPAGTRCNCCLARRLNGRPASSINPCNLQASKFLFLGCLVAIKGEFVKRIFRLRRRLSGLYKRKDNKCAKHTNGYSSINVRKQTTKI